jgi:glycosyltransferase involved in cell wall biosynthesis
MKICIVIPCYNEADRLPLEQIQIFLQNPSYKNINLCLVNDGSSDATISVLEDLRRRFPDQILVHDLPQNMGKAEAVRQGTLAAMSWQTHEGYAYFDADLATPLEEISWLVQWLLSGDYLMAFGSRVLRMGGHIARKATRHYFGRVFATAASLVVPLPIYDSQCGAKLLRHELAQQVYQAPFLSRWLFDLEIFLRVIAQHGYQKALHGIIEVPLRQWVEVGGSKLKLSDLWKVPFELRRIKRFYGGSSLFLKNP